MITGRKIKERRNEVRRKYDSGKGGERREDGQETQVIKGTVGKERERKGMGKHAKRKGK